MKFTGKKVLILEGGGFKTSFSTGVLDAFRMTGYDDFDVHIGVSGGTLALSYFLSHQFGSYIGSMKMICKDPRFVQLSKAFKTGLMNLDFFYEIAEKEFPFDMEKALSELERKEFYMVLTNSIDGTTAYKQPRADNWVDMTIAASTVPLLTKGKHEIDGVPYSDGGISDPIPIKWAVENGASEIVLIRTTSMNFKPGIIRPEIMAAKILKASDSIKQQIENFQLKIKESIDYIGHLADSSFIHQIAPESGLNTNIFTNSVNSIALDYRYGLEAGMKSVHEQKLKERELILP